MRKTQSPIGPWRPQGNMSGTVLLPWTHRPDKKCCVADEHPADPGESEGSGRTMCQIKEGLIFIFIFIIVAHGGGGSFRSVLTCWGILKRTWEHSLNMSSISSGVVGIRGMFRVKLLCSRSCRWLSNLVSQGCLTPAQVKVTLYNDDLTHTHTHTNKGDWPSGQIRVMLQMSDG